MGAASRHDLVLDVEWSKLKALSMSAERNVEKLSS